MLGTIGTRVLDVTTRESRLLHYFNYQDAWARRLNSLYRSDPRASTRCSRCGGFVGSRKYEATLLHEPRPTGSSASRVPGDRKRVTLRSQSLPHQSDYLFEVWLTRSRIAQDRQGGATVGRRWNGCPRDQDRVVGPPGRPGAIRWTGYGPGRVSWTGAPVATERATTFSGPYVVILSAGGSTVTVNVRQPSEGIPYRCPMCKASISPSDQ